MSDLLVKLYDLPSPDTGPAPAVVRRALASEKRAVAEWVATRFGPGWASECEVAFGNRPLSCHLAVRDGEPAGFACWDATCRGFFGPLGVDERHRRQGIGRALLLDCLRAMVANGYGYAVVGWAHSPRFYAEAVGAVEIPGSEPGIYRDRLRESPP